MFGKYSVIAILIIFLTAGACNPKPESLISHASCIGADATENTLPTYAPSPIRTFIALDNGQFILNGSIFIARGVNYYPSHYPWRRFLFEAELSDVQHDFLLLHTVGFNTLRLFLWNDALFTCSGEKMFPNKDAFNRLDSIIQEAAASGFRLIITLNDLPDDSLYTKLAYTQEQNRFIIERYRNEAAILAWDLRNEGDIDYGSNDALGRGNTTKQEVLDWLHETAVLVRDLDSRHLITAGWLHDSEFHRARCRFSQFSPLD